MRLKVRVRYEGQDMAFDMPVGDGRMTIKWLGERARSSGAEKSQIDLRWVVFGVDLPKFASTESFDEMACIHRSCSQPPTHPLYALKMW